MLTVTGRSASEKPVLASCAPSRRAPPSKEIAPVAGPRLLLAAADTMPPLQETPPSKVFAPASDKVPAPVLTRPPLETTLRSVSERLADTSNARVAPSRSMLSFSLLLALPSVTLAVVPPVVSTSTSPCSFSERSPPAARNVSAKLPPYPKTSPLAAV